MSVSFVETLKEQFEKAREEPDPAWVSEREDSHIVVSVLSNAIHKLYWLPDRPLSLMSSRYEGESSPPRNRHYILANDLTIIAIEKTSSAPIEMAYRVALQRFDQDSDPFLIFDIRDLSWMRLKEESLPLEGYTTAQLLLLAKRLPQAGRITPQVYSLYQNIGRNHSR